MSSTRPSTDQDLEDWWNRKLNALRAALDAKDAELAAVTADYNKLRDELANKYVEAHDLRAQLATLTAERDAARAEVERLRGIVKEVIGYCSGSRVAHIGEFKAFIPQIDVEAIKRWRETVEGGEK